MSASPPMHQATHLLRARAGGAALAAVCAAAMAASFTAAQGGFAAAAFVPVVAIIAITDARRFIIPDALNAAGLGLGLLHAAATAADPWDGMLAALARGAALAGLFLALGLGYRALRGRDGLGLGDVKLTAVAGAWLDVEVMSIAIEIAVLAALLTYGLRQVRHGRGRPVLRGHDRLPFGSFLAPAIWIGWMLDRWILAPW